LPGSKLVPLCKVSSCDDRASRGFGGGQRDRGGDPALEPGRSGLAQLLERQAGGAVGLDSRPALLAGEEVIVEAPLLIRGKLAGEKGD
jgi:hypothetical protein